MSRGEFAAFMLRHAGQACYMRELREELTSAIKSHARREAWPDRVEGRQYIEGLCRLAVIEELYPGLHRVKIWLTEGKLITGVWRPVLGWVEPWVWSRVLSPRYGTVRAIVDAWAGTAYSKMAPTLSSF